MDNATLDTPHQNHRAHHIFITDIGAARQRRSGAVEEIEERIGPRRGGAGDFGRFGLDLPLCRTYDVWLNQIIAEDIFDKVLVNCATFFVRRVTIMEKLVAQNGSQICHDRHCEIKKL